MCRLSPKVFWLLKMEKKKDPRKKATGAPMAAPKLLWHSSMLFSRVLALIRSLDLSSPSCRILSTSAEAPGGAAFKIMRLRTTAFKISH